MDTNALKKFAQSARRQLLSQVSARMEQVLTTDTAILREKRWVIEQLRGEVAERGKPEIIEEVAYTWFNRLCALRYMDVNNYTRVGIVSPAEGFTQPEILQQAKQGLIDKDWQLNRKQVSGLLDHSIPSPDPDQEAYRLLLVAACNSYNRQMDFLFTAIEDVTELLMPEDLLSNQSVLQAVRDTLTPEVCQDVEVIGWLYQFYISEKKDQVMAAKGAVKKEDIPSVTQLFTPDWIVRYMVQNSLGRLWLLNHPNSSVRKQMDYFVQPADPETDFLKVSSPEDLKVLDPACGSGHILTYAFDLLYAIYEEQGYDPLRIPQYILQKNLYGIEIDKRAAMLSSFALMMKARAKDKRFFSRGIKPNILEMEDVRFEPAEIKAYLDKLGRDLYTQDLWEGLQQFENTKTFGSLIRPAIKDVPTLRQRMEETRIFDDLLLSNTNDKLLKVLEMSEYLSPRYQVVVANPPYFSKGMDADYKQFAEQNYPDSKADTLSMFIERNLDIAQKGGYVGMITLMSWMFLSYFEKLRQKLLSEDTLLSMAHLGARAFDTIGGEVVSTTMFILRNVVRFDHRGEYFRLIDGMSEGEKKTTLLEGITNPGCGWFYRASAQDFKKIPAARIGYWISEDLIEALKGPNIEDIADFTGSQNKTANNDRYIRLWFELSNNHINKNGWVIYSKGGEYRKYYGNLYWCVNWSTEARNYYQTNPTSNLLGKQYWYREGISYTDLTSKAFNARYFPSGGVYDMSGPVFHVEAPNLFATLSLVNTNVFSYILNLFNPTFHYKVNNVKAGPVPLPLPEESEINGRRLVEISKKDWDSFEYSRDFSSHPILINLSEIDNDTLEFAFQNLVKDWQSMVEESKRLEERNNEVFSIKLGLDNLLSNSIELSDVSLTCNPRFRYSNSLGETQLNARVRENTMKEFLSYAVGCMFGRYSLDKPGLILANQGETLQDFLNIIGTKPTFTPTETNVIPILEGDWFPDDVTTRFKQLLKITFGEPNFEENLRFIENALGKDLRRYFLKDFYKDHLQTYQKRPIYWLFSSPKGSFNALVYMHRYQPNTVSVVLNQYLREYREKLNAQKRYQDSLSISPACSPREKTAALKEIENISKILTELKTYEDEILFPLAGEQIEIDLDDGVVVNYAKFGDALRKI